MADALSTTSSVKRQRTNDDSNYKYSNWGLDLSVATRRESRYKELLRKIQQAKSLPIRSYLAGNTPSEVKNGLTGIRYTTHGHVVYFICSMYSRSVHMYKSTIDTWYRLPDRPAQIQHVHAIFMIKGELTAIGEDNKLYTLTGQGAKQQWSEEYPPLPVDQCVYALTVICVGKALIVFTSTGSMNDYMYISCNHCALIMNIESRQWSTGSSLLIPTKSIWDPGWKLQSHVEFYDSHIWVFDTCVSKCTKYHLDTLLSSCEPPIFEQVPPAHQVLSTQFSFFPIDLTIGSKGTLIGEYYGDDDCCCNPSRVIRKYNQTNDSWKLVELPISKYAKIVALPDNRFMTISCFTDRVLFFTID